jgi:hypothetical protein
MAQALLQRVRAVPPPVLVVMGVAVAGLALVIVLAVVDLVDLSTGLGVYSVILALYAVLVAELTVREGREMATDVQGVATDLREERNVAWLVRTMPIRRAVWGIYDTLFPRPGTTWTGWSPRTRWPSSGSCLRPSSTGPTPRWTSRWCTNSTSSSA